MLQAIERKRKGAGIRFLPELPKRLCDGCSLNPTQQALWRNEIRTFKQYDIYWKTVEAKFSIPPKRSSRAWEPVVIRTTDFLYKQKQSFSIQMLNKPSHISRNRTYLQDRHLNVIKINETNLEKSITSSHIPKVLKEKNCCHGQNDETH